MKYVFDEVRGLVPHEPPPKRDPSTIELVSGVAGGRKRRTYKWRDGGLVETTRGDEDFCRRRPGRKMGMFVPGTIKTSEGDRVTIMPGKKTRERMRKEGRL